MRLSHNLLHYVLMLSCLTLVVLLGVDIAFAQEAAPALPTDGTIAGFIPAAWLPYIVILNAVLTLASRVADITPTDKDNKAVGWISNIFNLLGGHVASLGGKKV